MALSYIFSVEMADDLPETTHAPANVFAVLIELDRAETAHALAYILTVDVVQDGPKAVQAPADIFAVDIIDDLPKAADASADVLVRQHFTRSFIVLGDGGVRPSRRGLVAAAGLFVCFHRIIVSGACEAGGISKRISGPKLTVFAHAAFAVVIFGHEIKTSYVS